jgi:hypothetical protein
MRKQILPRFELPRFQGERIINCKIWGYIGTAPTDHENDFLSLEGKDEEFPGLSTPPKGEGSP